MKKLAFGLVAGVCACVCAAPALAKGPNNAPKNVNLPNGYFMQALAVGLDFPTAIAFGEGKIWVSEAGITGDPAIVRVNANGSTTTILKPSDLDEGVLMGPITDVTYHAGLLWVTHRTTGESGLTVGAVSSFDPDDPDGTFETVITNLPAAGDHSVEEIVFDRSGRAFISIGSATNSGVVGADNALVTGWLEGAPSFHDFAPVDLTLNGTSFQTAFAFSLDPSASMITAPYHAFGSGAVAAGTVVPAATPATPQEGMIAGNGTVYSFDPKAGDPTSTLKLEAWGFRNPFGMAFDPANASHLFVTNNGSDTRSTESGDELTVIESRPIEEDYDDLFGLTTGGEVEFFGWPDFFHDPESGQVMNIREELFCEQEELSFPCPAPILATSQEESLSTLPALAQFEEHSSANKFDVATSKRFKFTGDLFVAETGSLPPVTGAEEFTGYSVVRANPATGLVSDFITHTVNNSEVIFQSDGFNKPIDVKFRGDLMYIVDFGVFEPGAGRIEEGTGKIWVVSHGKGPINVVGSPKPQSSGLLNRGR